MRAQGVYGCDVSERDSEVDELVNADIEFDIGSSGDEDDEDDDEGEGKEGPETSEASEDPDYGDGNQAPAKSPMDGQAITFKWGASNF